MQSTSSIQYPSKHSLHSFSNPQLYSFAQAWVKMFCNSWGSTTNTWNALLLFNSVNIPILKDIWSNEITQDVTAYSNKLFYLQKIKWKLPIHIINTPSITIFYIWFELENKDLQSHCQVSVDNSLHYSFVVMLCVWFSAEWNSQEIQYFHMMRWIREFIKINCVSVNITACA